jgi:hypothetical protein
MTASDMPLHPSDSGFERESGHLLPISRQIRQIPYLDPPEIMLPSVMRAIRQKPFPWWFRMIRWARSPRSFSFTPLQAVASLASILVLISAAGALFLSRYEHRYTLQSRATNQMPITLSLNMPEARSVSVVGTFNAWDDKGYEMKKDKSMGTWTLVLHLPAGHHEYAFVLDGKEIIPDPRADFFKDDGFGNQNAVLIVGNHHDRTI